MDHNFRRKRVHRAFVGVHCGACRVKYDRIILLVRPMCFEFCFAPTISGLCTVRYCRAFEVMYSLDTAAADALALSEMRRQWGNMLLATDIDTLWERCVIEFASCASRRTVVRYPHRIDSSAAFLTLRAATTMALCPLTSCLRMCWACVQQARCGARARFALSHASAASREHRVPS
jgi:hypothetical protein